MVLKKSKFSANTGGTQRKSPFFKMPRTYRNGLITKEDNTALLEGQNSKLKQLQLFDKLDGGLTGLHEDLCFSMKKKQRWLIPELIEDHILEISVSSSCDQSVGSQKQKRKSKKQERKKLQSQLQGENDVAPTIPNTGPRIVLVENGFQQRRRNRGFNECKAVYDSGDTEIPIKKSRSW